MSAARLACYLTGGCPPGGRLTHRGARDTNLPSRSLAFTLPGRVFFAGESRVWGGGRAFYDPGVRGPSPARAYLVTAEQFDDIRSQEPSVYDRLLEVGVRDGHPMLTFTSAHGMHDLSPAAPADAYLHTIGEGIAEAHGWDPVQVAEHLAGLAAIAR
jgi:hypothetical protein